MTWVKLCGMRSAADVAAAAVAGADAIGFVTAPGSIRRVSPSDVAAFGEATSLETFLVTLDQEPTTLVSAARDAGVTGVQPHGRFRWEAAETALDAGFTVLFPIAIGELGTDRIAPAGAIPIIDGPRPGSGSAVDLAGLRGLPAPCVIAGGLTVANVGDICDRLRPYGVDVSSGIEAKRGIKDPELMTAFVLAVR